MNDYKNVSGIFNTDTKDGRFYTTPDGDFTSVTTMLGKTSSKPGIEAWKLRVGEEEAQRVLDRASARGTLTHKYLEDLYLQSDTHTRESYIEYRKISGLLNEEPYIIKMVDNIVLTLLSNEYVSLAQEIAVWSPALKLAGRCDSIGLWHGRLILVDYKTSIKYKPQAYIKDYYLQATAYCIMHNEMYKEQINKFVIIIANEEGGLQTLPGTPSVYAPELKYRIKKYHELQPR